MGMLLGILLFVFVVLGILAGAALWIDRSAATHGSMQGQRKHQQ